MAVGVFKIAPSEFWQMTPKEFGLIYEMNVPKAEGDKLAGSLDEEAAEELYQLLEDSE